MFQNSNVKSEIKSLRQQWNETRGALEGKHGNKDVETILSDSEKCLEYIANQRGKRLPVLFYELVDNKNTDTISIFSGRAVQLDK